ncbi:MAG: PAS domain S-box protein [Ignavibacteria bacterium]|nr:PAS domain S-box protein [Ignavibacteria bacterium]
MIGFRVCEWGSKEPGNLRNALFLCVCLLVLLFVSEGKKDTLPNKTTNTPQCVFSNTIPEKPGTGGLLLLSVLFSIFPLIAGHRTGDEETEEKRDSFLKDNWFLQQAFEQPDEGIMILNEQGGQTFHNTAARNILGDALQSFYEKHLRQLITTGLPTDNITLPPKGSAKHFQYSLDLLSAEGKIRSLQIVTKYLFDERDIYRGMMVIIRDVSDYKKVQKDLLEAYTYLNAVIQNIDKRIWVKGLDGRYLLTNPKFNQDMNLPAQADLKGLSDKDLGFAEQSLQFYQEDQKVIQSKAALHIEEKRDIGSGPRWYETSKYPICNESGEVIAVFGFSSDITERKNQEELLVGIAEGISAATGNEFFSSVALHIAGATGARQVFIGSFTPFDEYEIQSLAFCREGVIENNFSLFMKDTPLADIILSPRSVFADNVEWLVNIQNGRVGKGMASYAGIRLLDSAGEVIGIMFLLFDRSVVNTVFIDSLLRIFSARVATELERTIKETQLAESEYKYRTLVENITDTIFRLNSNSRIAYVSENISNLSGYTAQEMMGESILQYIHPQDISSVLMSVTGAFARITGPFEFRLHQKAGGFLWVSVTGQPYTQEGQVVGIQCIMRSVNERKMVEEALLESQEQLRGLVENSHDGIVVINDELKITEWNKAMQSITGYEKAEVLGKDFISTSFQFLAPELRTSQYYNFLRKQYFNAIEKGTDKWLNKIQHRKIVRRSGEIGHIEEITYITQTRAGVFLCTLMRDITNVRKVEQEITKLSSAIEQNPATIMITDAKGRIEYVNPVFSQLTGYSREEVIGRTPGFLKTGHTSSEEYRSLWATITNGDIWRGEFLNRRKNGELFWESSAIFSIKNHNGLITNFVAIKEDITQRKKMEADLVEAKDKAEEMSRVKSSFFANMSHELRTPMNSILGYSQILKDEYQEERVHSIGSTIYRSGRRLLDTLNLILDLSLIEAEKVDLQITQFDIVQLVEDILKHFTPAAQQKNLHLEYKPEYPVIEVHSDERMMRQVVTNLVNNAIKYTLQGTVTVTLEFVAWNRETRTEAHCLIHVKDTGIGIPEEKLSMIFDEFRQVSEGFNRSFEGSGLGLTITKRFVEKLHGEISVESAIHEGSCFTVKIPINITI